MNYYFQQILDSVSTNDFRNAYFDAVDNERKEFFELLMKKFYDAIY